MRSPNRFRASSHYQSKKNSSPPLVPETLLTAVHVRCRTRRLSVVRIDLARRTDDSGSVEFCASRRVYEEQPTRERRRRKVPAYCISSGSSRTKVGSVCPAAHLHDQRSMPGDWLGTYEALRTDRNWTSCHNNGRTSAPRDSPLAFVTA